MCVPHVSFKHRIMFTVFKKLRYRIFFFFCKKLTNILLPLHEQQLYLHETRPFKRDNHYLPKLFCTMHASGRIFMRKLNISVVVLGSHTRVIYSSGHEIIETVGGTSVCLRSWRGSSFTSSSSSIFTIQFRACFSPLLPLPS